jgi:hypothetical protein
MLTPLYFLVLGHSTARILKLKVRCFRNESNHIFIVLLNLLRGKLAPCRLKTLMSNFNGLLIRF